MNNREFWFWSYFTMYIAINMIMVANTPKIFTLTIMGGQLVTSAVLMTMAKIRK